MSSGRRGSADLHAVRLQQIGVVVGCVLHPRSESCVSPAQGVQGRSAICSAAMGGKRDGLTAVRSFCKKTSVYGTITANQGSTVNMTGRSISRHGNNFSLIGTAPATISLSNNVTNWTVQTTGGDIDITGTQIFGSLVTQNAPSVLLTTAPSSNRMSR